MTISALMAASRDYHFARPVVPQRTSQWAVKAAALTLLCKRVEVLAASAPMRGEDDQRGTCALDVDLQRHIFAMNDFAGGVLSHASFSLPMCDNYS